MKIQIVILIFLSLFVAWAKSGLLSAYEDSYEDHQDYGDVSYFDHFLEKRSLWNDFKDAGNGVYKAKL
jgi:hypothetical protein